MGSYTALHNKSIGGALPQRHQKENSHLSQLVMKGSEMGFQVLALFKVVFHDFPKLGYRPTSAPPLPRWCHVHRLQDLSLYNISEMYYIYIYF